MKKSPSRKRIDTPFAKNLNALLKERGITQRVAAEIAGVNSATINQWLSGAQPNDAMAVLKLSKGLMCDFQWLLTGLHSDRSNAKDLSLSELFDFHNNSELSALFLIDAKRLKRKE